MDYVKINNIKYPATIIYRERDSSWDNRASKEITLTLPYEEVSKLFIDDVEWSIVTENKNTPLNFNNMLLKLGSTINEYDNSNYCVAGDIVDHRDGTISVKMGKPTAEELLSMIMEGISKW